MLFRSIEKPARLRVIGDCIERKIAAREVLFDGGSEGHHGMPTVGLDVATEGRDFVHRAAPVEHADSPEFDSDRNGARKESPHLLGGGSRGQVPVEVRVAEEGISNSAAHAPCLEPLILQSLGDVEDRAWRRERRFCRGL